MIYISLRATANNSFWLADLNKPVRLLDFGLSVAHLFNFFEFSVMAMAFVKYLTWHEQSHTRIHRTTTSARCQRGQPFLYIPWNVNGADHFFSGSKSSRYLKLKESHRQIMPLCHVAFASHISTAPMKSEPRQLKSSFYANWKVFEDELTTPLMQSCKCKQKKVRKTWMQMSLYFTVANSA